jgi:hypothetical protein
MLKRADIRNAAIFGSKDMIRDELIEGGIVHVGK